MSTPHEVARTGEPELTAKARRRKPVNFPDDRIRVEFTRELRVGNLLFAKGEAWDTWRYRINADGSLNVGQGVVEPGQWREVCTWRPDVDAPPETPAQRAAWESLHGKDAVRRG